MGCIERTSKTWPVDLLQSGTPYFQLGVTEGLLTVAAACAAYSLFSLPVSARFMQFNVNYRLSTNRGVGLIIRGHAAAGATHTQFCRSELYAALSSGQPLLLAAAQSLVSCESCESAERA